MNDDREEPTPPEASVVIPAFNAGGVLSEQLDALAQQRVSLVWEILVCDNGSTDDTRKVVEEWRERLPQLRLIDAAARRGPSAARNIGAAHAKGATLLFCDADDVVAVDWLSRMLDTGRRVPLFAGRFESEALNTENRASVSWSANATITERIWPRFPVAGAGNLGVRTSLFRALGGFDEALGTCEDVDFCWRAQMRGVELVRVDDAVVHIRKRDGVRAVYRQAFAYGRGRRALAAKYARVIAADEGQESDAAESPSADRGAVATPRSRSARGITVAFVRKLSASATRAGRANAAWRLGEWAGERFGQVPEGIEPLGTARKPPSP